jgi:hypothetical protein
MDLSQYFIPFVVGLMSVFLGVLAVVTAINHEPRK